MTMVYFLSMFDGWDWRPTGDEFVTPAAARAKQELLARRHPNHQFAIKCKRVFLHAVP
jgi:hypothetical protein